MTRVALCLLWLACGCAPLTMRVSHGQRSSVDAAAPILDELADDLQVLDDPQMLRRAAAANVLRAERAIAVAPTSPLVLLQACRSHVLYGLAFIERDYQRLEDAGDDYEAADRTRARAERFFQRGKQLCFRSLTQLTEHFPGALEAGPERLAELLRTRFRREEHASYLFWSALAWAKSIQLASDGFEGAGNLTPVRTLADRVLELDETVFNGGALTLAAALRCALPDALGGESEQGKALFERALVVSERKNLTVQITYARVYALNQEDEALYRKLLEEVRDAPDHGDRVRLGNTLSKQDALHFLETIDEVFY